MSQSKSFTDQLADVLGRHLDGHLSDVEQEIHRLKEGFSSSLDALHARLKGEARERLHGALTRAASDLAGDASTALAARHESRLTALAGACRRILASRTQAEILAALADGAAPFSSRTVLFISKGEYLVPWEMRGFGSPESLTGIRATQIPKRSETTLAKACQEQRPMHGDLGSHRENAQLAERLGGGCPEKLICLPLVVHERSTAVLYADHVPDQGEPLNPEALSLLVEMAQVRIELYALETRLGIKPSRPAASAAAVPKPMESPLASVAAVTPAALPASAPPAAVQEPWERIPERKLEPVIEPVIPLREPEAAAPPREPEVTTMLTSPLTSPMRPAMEQEPAAGRIAQAMTDSEATTQLNLHDIPMFGAAPLEAETPLIPETDTPAEEAIEIDLDSIFSPANSVADIELPPIESAISFDERQQRIGFVDQPPPIPVIPFPPPLPREEPEAYAVPPVAAEPAAPSASELERLHNEAKRFARLLASEIKLYNEHAVNEGRRQRDLYDRLRKEIDRSRSLYDKRVSPLVARRADYFHDELVRILGANDPMALGSDYPGPRLSTEESGS